MMSAESIRHWIEVFAARLASALQRHESGAVDWHGRRLARDELQRRPDMAATIKARMASRRGDLETEIAAYRTAIETGFVQPYWVFRNLGYALEQRGSHHEALGCFQAAAEREANPIIGWTIVAEQLFARGKRTAARRQLNETEGLAAGDAMAFEVCARSWRRLGSGKDAVRCLENSLDLRPDNPASELLLADALLSQRQFSDAERLITACLEKYPDRVDFVRLLGSMQRVRGDTEAAVNTLRRAVQLDPTKPGVYLELSKILDAKGEFEEATRLADRAVSMLPTSAHFHYWRGLLFKKQRKRDEARESFARAIELDPGLAAAKRQMKWLNWHVGHRLMASIGGRPF